MAVFVSLPLLALALPAAADAASTKTYSGTVGKSACKYSVTAEWSTTEPTEGKLTNASLSCGSAFSIALVASWHETEVTLEEVSGSLAGHSLGKKTLHETLELPTPPTTDLGAMLEEAAPKLLEKAQAQLLKSPLKLKGEIGSSGCTWEAEASWSGTDLSSGNISGAIGCGSALSFGLTAGWSEETATIEKLTATVAGSEQDLPSGESFTMPDAGALDLPDLIEQAIPAIEGAAEGAITNTGLGLGNGFPGNSLTQLLDNTPESLPGEVLAALDSRCEKGTKDNRECHTLEKEEATKPPYGSISDDVADHKPAGACPLPFVEEAEEADNVAVVCIPVVLGGTFDAGSRDVVVVPGGAILAVGPGSGSNEPAIKTSGSVLFMGGAVGGGGLRIDAGGSVEIAASYVSLFGSLQIHASGAVKVGEVEAGRLLEGIGGVAIPPGGTLTAGADMLAGHVAIESGEMSVASGSSVSGDGVGGPGGPCMLECLSGPWGIAPKTAGQPGGSSFMWGGSHAGFGSYGYEDPVTHVGWEQLDPAAPATWGQPSLSPPPGRGGTFDDAFDPKEPGGGGGGAELDHGWDGGGVIEIASTSLQLNGTLSADGNGWIEPPGSGGGSGGGGAINVATGGLSGDGKLEADGGGLCEACGNGLGGGDGGGGMISERYISNSFTGTSQAFGGEDLNNAALDLRPNGGAGTVYLLQTEKAPSAPTYGSSNKEDEEEEEEVPGLEDLAKPAAPEAPQSAGTSAMPTGAENDAVAGAGKPSPTRMRIVSLPTCSTRVVTHGPRACAARVGTAHPIKAVRLAKLNLSPTAFVPDPTGIGARAAAAGWKTGTTVSYSDNAAATTTFTVDTPLPGAIKRRHCVRASRVPARERRKLKRCAYLSPDGSFNHSDRRGTNSLHFTGRLGHGALRPGAYELRATPHVSHITGPTLIKTFHILAPTPVPPTGPKEGVKEAPKGNPGESPHESPKTASTGTLIINDGHSAAEPPNDGTPLPEGSQTKNMTLEIEGGARVYASHGEWAKIVLSGDSRLTMEPPSKLPAPALDVKAGEIEVQAGSRIEANSLGYAGAGLEEEKGRSAPGVTVSTWAAGGSHGGRGAVNPGLHETGKSESGDAYDNPEDPTLPGGGGGGGYNATTRASSGGGVIDLTAGTLVLDGLIQANGENDWGPTLEEPFWYELGGGTGAGGSIQVHVQTLSGSGEIQADGGTACVQTAENSDPALSIPCAGVPGENESTGGGGLVLVQAPNHAGFTGQITAAGGQHGYADGSAGIVTGP